MAQPDSVVARMAVGDALEFLRVSAGISMDELGAAMGTDDGGYGMVAVGNRPLLFTEALLAAHALGVSAAKLVEIFEQSFGPIERPIPPTAEEVAAVQRRRMRGLLIRLEGEGREGVREFREWLEENYLLEKGPTDGEEPSGSVDGFGR